MPKEFQCQECGRSNIHEKDCPYVVCNPPKVQPEMTNIMQEVVTLDSFARISIDWVKHNSVTDNVRLICECAGCQLYRRIAIDDVIARKVPFLRMFVASGGTADELRRHYGQHEQ